MILKQLTKKQRQILDIVMKSPKTYAQLEQFLMFQREAIYYRVILMRKKGYLEPSGKIKATPEGIHSIIERLSL